jgi:16S rRNA (cytosine967-C5)-methyltransferase
MPDVTESARGVVLTRLARRARAFPDLPLDAMNVEGLSDRDAALATAIDHAVARRWLTLVNAITRFLSRPWAEVEPSMQAALLGGAAQLLLLDRLPDHAVINETVEWTKHAIRPKAGGMANAILRRIAEMRTGKVVMFDSKRRDVILRSDGTAMRLDKNILPEDEEARLSVQTSVPRLLLAHWTTTFGRDVAESLAYHSMMFPPIIVTGVDDDELIDNIVEAVDVDGGMDADTPGDLAEHHEHDEAGGVGGDGGGEGGGEGAVAERKMYERHLVPDFYVFHGTTTALRGVMERCPRARVQDPGSAAPVEMTRSLSPGLIMDVCAGQGTKTKQLAALHPNARIIATDVDDARRRILHETFDHDDQVTVIEADQRMDYAGQADLLVLDVPCSNTGVLARRVEARYRWRDATMNQLVNLQRQIMADSIALLAPGGHMLYATCSIDAAENAEQSEWVRKWHDFREVAVSTRWPAGAPGDSPTVYVDGGYACLLAR